MNAKLRTLFLGGLLPIVAFAIIEEWYGPIWGTVAGLVFGAGEIFWEWRSEGRVSSLTLTSNAFVFVLGIVTIWTDEGIWFKLQPALLLLVLAIWILLSSYWKKPLLLNLALKQNPQIPPSVQTFFAALNTRLGFFLLGLTALSVWAALDWSTAAWALLKGVGAPILMGVYLVIEILIYRRRPPPAGFSGP